MPPHIHYLSSPTLTFPIIPHRRRNVHLLRRREPHQQRNGYHPCCRASRWDDSNAESFTAHSFIYSDQENVAEEEDYTLKWDLDVFQEYIDSIWILKVFKGYGFTLPFILAPMVLVNGLESFLLATLAAILASTFLFAVQKMSYSQKHVRSNTEKKKKTERNEFGSAKKAEKGFKTWVPSDDESSFGGWDEVDYGNGYSKVGRRSEKKKNSRRRRRRERTASSPLLLRLLITVFPFLSSWTKML